MKNKSGMTLIEVVISLAIFGIIVVAIYPAFLVLAKMNILSEANLTSNYIAQDVSESIYHYSKTISEDQLIANIVNDGYTLIEQNGDNYRLVKTENGYQITINVNFNDPQNNFVSVIVEVASTNVTISGQKSQIESVLSFGG